MTLNHIFQWKFQIFTILIVLSFFILVVLDFNFRKLVDFESAVSGRKLTQLITKNITYKNDRLTENIQVTLNPDLLAKIKCSKCRYPLSRENHKAFENRMKLTDIGNGPYYSNVSVIDENVYIKNFTENHRLELETGIQTLLVLQPNLKKVFDWYGKVSSSNSTQLIPNYFHFVLFGCEKILNLINYIAFMSVIRFTTSDSKIFLHKMKECKIEDNFEKSKHADFTTG